MHKKNCTYILHIFRNSKVWKDHNGEIRARFQAKKIVPPSSIQMQLSGTSGWQQQSNMAVGKKIAQSHKFLSSGNKLVISDYYCLYRKKLIFESSDNGRRCMLKKHEKIWTRSIMNCHSFEGGLNIINFFCKKM